MKINVPDRGRQRGAGSINTGTRFFPRRRARYVQLLGIVIFVAAMVTVWLPLVGDGAAHQDFDATH